MSALCATSEILHIPFFSCFLRAGREHTLQVCNMNGRVKARYLVRHPLYASGLAVEVGWKVVHDAPQPSLACFYDQVIRTTFSPLSFSSGSWYPRFLQPAHELAQVLAVSDDVDRAAVQRRVRIPFGDDVDGAQERKEAGRLLMSPKAVQINIRRRFACAPMGLLVCS